MPVTNPGGNLRPATTAEAVDLPFWQAHANTRDAIDQEIRGSVVEAGEVAESLSARLRQVEYSVATQDPNWYHAENLVSNPTYSPFPGAWKFLGGNGVAAAGAATITGSGAIQGVGLYQALTVPVRAGHRYYVRAEITPVDAAFAVSASLTSGGQHVSVNGRDGSVTNPPTGTETLVSGVLSVPSAWEGQSAEFYQRAFFTSSAGKKATFGAPAVIDLTETYGPGNEPSKAHLDGIFSARPGGMLVGRSTRFEKRPGNESPAPGTVVMAGGGASSPLVELRFDDGYVSNLTNAAPVMARHGFRGVIYPGTHPTAWLGGSHGGHPIMNAAQLLSIHSDFGWEVGSHTRDHSDANNGDPYVWVENARQACQDLVNIGLPWPSAFAYPNGARNVVTDRAVYRLHDTCGLTGHPSLTPIRKGEPAFFTGWATTSGTSNTAADMERAKTYVLESTRRGEIPILGFHGITDGTPNAAHHLSKAHFTELVRWLADQGFSTVLPSERTPHNMLKDPGFETRELGYPWVAGTGWSRSRSTATGHTGFMGADLASGGTGELYQNTSVLPGQSLRVRVRFGARTVSGGTLAVVATPQGPTGDPVGSPFTIGSVTSGSAEVDVTGLVTVPSGASVLKVAVVPSGFTGTARVVHAALYRSDLYDPLA